MTSKLSRIVSDTSFFLKISYLEKTRPIGNKFYPTGDSEH